MLELPEAVVIAQQINHTLTGKRIKRATANHTPHKFAWYTGDPANYNNLLAGKTIGTASPCAGEVEIKADDMLLVIGAAMRYHDEGENLPSKHQLFLEFDDQTALTVTIQMWGGIFCVKKGERVGFEDYTRAHKQPSPLSEQFDRAFFDTLFTEKTGVLSAKAFLATEQRIPGLGNGVLQDILWTAKIHPKRKMVTLSASEIDQMYAAVKSIIKEMAELGGRDTERDLYGRFGGYKTVLSKNTVETPCPACGMFIRKEPYLGGSIYYCPRCQLL